MKRISAICLLWLAAVGLPLRAANKQPITVRSGSVSKNRISIYAELAGKKIELSCTVGDPPCSATQPGEYVMVRADATEGIYNDCTNVVLYKASSGADEKIGVYCWLNSGDCYMTNCDSLQVETSVSTIPDKIAETSNTATAKLPKNGSSWHYPADSMAISSQSPPKPYEAAGLPVGTVSVLTKYIAPGLRVRRPDGKGFWEFETVAKLYYKGTMFAIVGVAKGVSERGNRHLGYANSVVIYDENGDGKLESAVDINSANGKYVFHLPRWVTR